MIESRDGTLNRLEGLQNLVEGLEIIDLTLSLETGMPAWPTQARFGSVVYDSYDWGGAALHSQITMSEHTGTHIDAPKHYIPGGCPIDELPLKTVMGRGAVIDVIGLKDRELLPPEGVRNFERLHGEIREGDIVMFRFGWDRKYRLQPDAGEYLRDWPGLAGDTAKYLAAKKIKAVGCDTLAIDAFDSAANEAHHILLGAGVVVIENIKNLDKLPAFSYVMGLPNKFKGGSGSPIRLIAFVEPEK
ncbi:MAG: cyclase family protein [Treponema sp.]|jgi:kynurenine formamidase|nr:cyclase family protein [Treponema sp.]